MNHFSLLHRIGFGLQLLALGVFPGLSAQAQSVVQPGYTLSLYSSGLNYAGLTVDPTSKAIFATQADTSTQLYRITPGALSLGGPFPNNGYPYGLSDIQYFNGSVYTAGFDGYIYAKNATTPGGLTATYDIGTGYEMGLATDGNSLFVTSGYSGGPPRIMQLNLTTGATTSLPGAGNLALNPTSLEYNPTNGKFYYFDYAASNTLRSHDPLTGASAVIGSANALGDYGNFAITPDGQYAVSRVGSEIRRISLSTGAATTLVSGLSSDTFQDVTFGPSSSGGGWSLYFGHHTTLLELKGFAAPPAKSTYILQPGSYASFTAIANTTAGSKGTTVDILGGTNTVARSVAVTFTGQDNTGLASDIVKLEGTFSDMIVLSLTYDESLFGDAVSLGWFDPNAEVWTLAVNGNTGAGNTPTFIDGAYNAAFHFHLGYYGRDAATNTVWAVINHNSDFGVVPEPGTCALVGVGLASLLLRWRRRGA